MADTTPTDPVPDAGTSDPVPEASTSETVPPARKPLSKQFNYQRLELPTPEQMQQQDGMNNCVVRALMAGAGGLVLGAGFGIVMGAMDPAAMDSPNLLRKPKTTMQVLKESAVLAKNRSMYVLLSPRVLPVPMCLQEYPLLTDSSACQRVCACAAQWSVPPAATASFCGTGPTSSGKAISSVPAREPLLYVVAPICCVNSL